MARDGDLDTTHLGLMVARISKEEEKLDKVREADRDARQRPDAHDTLLKNQQSAFQDLQCTVGDIAKSLKDRQGGLSLSPNASVMVVSIRSHREEDEVEEEVSHIADYGIPSLEEVKKVD
ncbi:hypothetical protein L1987_45866 [Smallanthus sonchifolius]|uniref:Uncharacterized protein n=1 Tax=Smallanthus sonchifolius TaxID=185202 RepID=A0ACB9FZ56_9ASTR|nr:hypothetical protein L1987_45866 [Smallanthus sonchifolius]